MTPFRGILFSETNFNVCMKRVDVHCENVSVGGVVCVRVWLERNEGVT